MIRTVQYPMVIRSENKIRGKRWQQLKRQGDAEKRDVTLFLRQLPPVKRVLAGGAHNLFEVKLVRLASGEGLDKDNCVAGFKNTQDAVAAWLGLDDADPRVRFTHRQQRCRMASGRAGFYVRVEIRCLEPGASAVKVLGEAPAELGEEAEQSPPPLGKRTKRRPLSTRIQPRLPVRTAWFQVPWDAEEVEELLQFAGVDTPPATIRVPIPTTWRPATLRGLQVEPGEAPMLTLFRTEHTHPEAGLIWLYVPWQPGAVTKAHTR